MNRREWARRMTWVAAALLITGLALLIAGSLIAGRGESPMQGVAIGTAGVMSLVVGALCGKFAIAGPYPKTLEAEAE